MGVINQWERIHALCALGSILLEWTFDKKKGTDPILEGKGECQKSFKFFSPRECTQIVQEGGGLVPNLNFMVLCLLCEYKGNEAESVGGGACKLLPRKSLP